MGFTGETVQKGERAEAFKIRTGYRNRTGCRYRSDLNCNMSVQEQVRGTVGRNQVEYTIEGSGNWMGMRESDGGMVMGRDQA